MNNQIFITGLIFGFIGLLYLLINFLIFQPILEFFKRLLYLKVTIEQNDVEIFETVIEWMKYQPFTKKTQNIQIKSEHREEEIDKLCYNIIPNLGTHFFWYSTSFIWLERSKAQMSLREGFDGTKSKEELTFFLFGLWSRSVMNILLEDAYQLYKEKRRGTTIILQANESGWMNATKKSSRELNSVILDKNLSDYVINDIENFVKSKIWYQKVGVPFRRGYMFFGPPGTGKTS